MFRDENVATLRVLSTAIALFALLAAAAGIAAPGLYRPIAPPETAPFLYGQDAVTLVAATALLFTLRSKAVATDVVQIGIVGYLFYAYAPYVMGTLYTYFYLAYMATLGLSIFYFIIAFVSIDYDRLQVAAPDWLRLAIVAFCGVIVVLFAPQWVVAIVGNIRTATWPGATGFHFFYYVYILDLCFVLPVCALTAIFLLRKRTLGYVLGGVIPVKGFTLMASVAAGFYCEPLFQRRLSVGDAAEFTILALVFLLLVVVYFANARFEPRAAR